MKSDLLSPDFNTASPALPDEAVLAPVVVNARTPEGVRGLLSYVETLTRHSNTEIADAEAHRLEPYFRALSEYVIEALQKPPPAHNNRKANWWSRLFNSTSPQAISTAWVSPLGAPSTPEALSDLFNAMAATTHGTLISDVVIVPSDIKKGPASKLFEGHREFNAPYKYLGHTFEFGFLQAYEGGEKLGAKSSTSFPIFTVDHKMIDALPRDGAEPLLRGLQQVLGVVNHDMLHHFTSAVIGSNTVHNDLAYKENPLKAWVNKLPTPSFFGPERYEQWALQSQENILRQPAAQPLVENARIALDDYMDRLDKIRNALIGPGSDPGSADEKTRKAHAVIDYFGTVMAHVLVRAFPLDHEIVQHCLARLEKIDPCPQEAARDCAAMLFGNLRDNATAAKALQIIRKNFSFTWSKTVDQVIQSYSRLGTEIFPQDDNDVSYKHFKMLQLIKLDGDYARDPDPKREILKEFRENMRDYTRAALTAAAKLSAPALRR